MRTSLLAIALAMLLRASVGWANTAASVPESYDPYEAGALNLELLGGGNAPFGNWAVGLAVDLNRRFTFSPGLSIGEGEELEPVNGSTGTNTWVFRRQWFGTFYRGNIEAGLSFRTQSPLSVRAFAGVGVPLTAPDCEYAVRSAEPVFGCENPAIPRDLVRRFPLLPYAGLSITVARLPLGAQRDAANAPHAADHDYGWQLIVADATAVAAGLTAAVGRKARTHSRTSGSLTRSLRQRCTASTGDTGVHWRAPPCELPCRSSAS